MAPTPGAKRSSTPDELWEEVKRLRLLLDRQKDEYRREVYELRSRIAEQQDTIEYLAAENIGYRKKRYHGTGRREEIRKLIRDAKTPCVDCGESDLRVIDFHHRNRKTKRGEQEAMVRDLWSDDEVHAELAQCDCVCKTCHAKRHLS